MKEPKAKYLKYSSESRMSDSSNQSESDENLEADFDDNVDYIDTTGILSQHNNSSVYDSTDEDIEEAYEAPTLETSTDPFICLPDDAQALILENLSGSDFKTASLVSKHWYHKFAHTEIISTKLTLKIDFIENENSQEDDLLALLKSHRRLTNVQIFIKNSKSINKKVDAILKKCSSYVEHLRIEKIGGLNAIFKQPMLFSKLESFVIHISGGRLSCALGNVHTLKYLSVDGIDLEPLEYCLVQNPGLEELTLHENAFISYFERYIIAYAQFKLKKFSVLDHLASPYALDGEFPAEIWEYNHRINFTMFLKSQASSLTSLHMSNCFAEDFKRIIKSLPRLTCLEINQMSGDLSKLKFEKNRNITTFIADSVQDELLQIVVNNFENLEFIYIGNVRTLQFFFTVLVSPKLQQFSYFWASSDVKEHGRFIDLKKSYRKCKNARHPNLKIQRIKKEIFIKDI